MLLSKEGLDVHQPAISETPPFSASPDQNGAAIVNGPSGDPEHARFMSPNMPTPFFTDIDLAAQNGRAGVQATPVANTGDFDGLA